jgi:hypothetical protein|tara:strand:+ start:1683 stop:1835 length:153 start_codon:yes stop_codon:yes gene_type:complete
MEYKEPKKRVTKNDKKDKNQVYSKKHIRIQIENIQNNIKKNNIRNRELDK